MSTPAAHAAKPAIIWRWMRHAVAAPVALALLAIAAADSAAAQRAPSPACDEAVSRHEVLGDLLALIGRLKEAVPLWSSYHPAAASYVFVIPAPEVQRCAVVWRGGMVRASFPLAAAPRLDTPLYGFYRSGRAEQQPQDLRDALEAADVGDAVILALDGAARLGLAMNSQSWFVDMALHEAVHLLVQFPARSGATTGFRWPSWTLPQPDRQELAARCYGSANPGEQRVNAERAPLAAAASNAVTGGPIENVCRETRAFMAERRRRWTALSEVRVPSEGGGAALSCEAGEAAMELNEGVPAFVAWLTARQLEVVDDRRLRAQLDVQSRDVFYTTGMMQLAVLQRLLGDEFTAVTERIASSSSSSTGAIFATLDAEVTRRCR